jgi:hypothetical protein
MKALTISSVGFEPSGKNMSTLSSAPATWQLTMSDPTVCKLARVIQRIVQSNDDFDFILDKVVETVLERLVEGFGTVAVRG